MTTLAAIDKSVMTVVPYPVVNMQGVLSNPNVALEAAKCGDLDRVGAGIAARVDARALTELRSSGLAAVNLTLGHVVGPQEPRSMTLDDIDAWDTFIAENRSNLLKVATTSDIVQAHASSRVGVIYGFQNSEMLGDDATSVEHFSRLGVRIMQLTYNGRNRVGDGCMIAQDRGLSTFGFEVLEQMHAQSVLVDLSHSSEQTCLDAIRVSVSPVSVTHTGCRALVDLRRNKSDAELRALAQKGGVVGIYGMPFLRASGQPSVADLIRHMEHAVNVCGEDHVGFGSDGSVTAVDDLGNYLRFLEEDVAKRKQAGVASAGESEAVALFLPDLSGPSQFLDLAYHLQKRGHSSLRIEKILGGNFLRLLREVWGS